MTVNINRSCSATTNVTGVASCTIATLHSEAGNDALTAASQAQRDYFVEPGCRSGPPAGCGLALHVAEFRLNHFYLRQRPVRSHAVEHPTTTHHPAELNVPIVVAVGVPNNAFSDHMRHFGSATPRARLRFTHPTTLRTHSVEIVDPPRRVPVTLPRVVTLRPGF